MSYKDLKIYSLVKRELDIYTDLLENKGTEDREVEDFSLSWLANTDFTIVGLYGKPPRYLKGVKKYTEYYLQITPSDDYYDLAVRKVFTDITKPAVINLQSSGGDLSTNKLFIPGDITDYLEIGSTHTILTPTEVVEGQAQVTSFSFVGASDYTEVVYDTSYSTMSIPGSKISFVKGALLVGLHIDIFWYDMNDEISKSKRVTKRFSRHAASNYEYSRRQRTINQMISAAKGTAIWPFVKTIYNHYKNSGYITNYINFGESKELKDAINNETDPKISGYLAIPISYTDIEGNVLSQTLGEAIKNDLYDGYN